MPPNTIYVGRPSTWGNPFKPEPEIGYYLDDVLRDYRDYVLSMTHEMPATFNLEQLRGKNLACWCKLERSGPDQCHAAVLLELANKGGNDI